MNDSGKLHMIFVATVVLLTIVCVTADGAPTPPAWPRLLLQSGVASTPVTGKTIRVPAGGDFQAAVHAQNGTAILFTVRNQDGKAPWCAVQDVTMINNVVRNSPTGFVVMGEDSPNKSQPSRRFLIRNNLFDRIERMAFYITSAADDVEIDHNTFVPTNYMSFCMTGLKGHDASGKVKGKPCNRFKLTNNIMGFGLYGPGIDGGQNSFVEAFPELTWDKNLFVGYGEGRAQSAMKRNTCPAGSLFEPKQATDGGYGDADWPAVGFADYSGGEYRLTRTSRYKGLGTDNEDLGVDMDSLVKATVAGSPSD